MEPVIFDDSPLAAYLKDEGDESEVEWAHLVETPSQVSSAPTDPSPQSSPTMGFAPTGRPSVKSRFRSHIPTALRLDIPPASSLHSIRKNYSAAVAASIDRADNAKFLEQFRYTIVASQLLSAFSVPGQPQPNQVASDATTTSPDALVLSPEGIIASVLGALGVAVVLSWALGSAPTHVTRKRMALLLLLAAAGVVLGQVYMRRQWLRYRREQSLSELRSFVSKSQNFDHATGAALSLVQEVELVSRGYRISAPLPPISRIEDRSQQRRCVRLRKALRTSFADALETYGQVSSVVKGFSEQTDLEKYYDIYDISDFDMSDALRGTEGTEGADAEDAESLRTLKVLAARFHTIRKMFLCALLALDAGEGNPDLLRWTTAVEALLTLNSSTEKAYHGLSSVLSEEELIAVPPTPKLPLTPGKERWRAQLRKINSLSTGIRGLQAKLQLLREESDLALNDSNDISELGPSLMSQYESIGADLKELMSAWEEGKAALALGIDRNEKRLSSMSTLFSPTSSISGLSTVEESCNDGSAEDALKALTGQSPRPSDFSEEREPEMFEAIARPRPRSILTREERIVKMREDRELKAQARQQMDATRGMLRELETVINLRPRNRTSLPLGGRIVSM